MCQLKEKIFNFLTFLEYTNECIHSKGHEKQENTSIFNRKP